MRYLREILFVLILSPLSVQANIVPVSLTVEAGSMMEPTDVLGENWRVDEVFSLNYSLVETQPHFVSIELSDGTTDVFDVGVFPDMTEVLPFTLGNPTNTILTRVPGTRGRLEFIGSTEVYPDDFIGLTSLFLTDLPFQIFDPQEYRYVINDMEFILPKGFVIPIPSAVILFGSSLVLLFGKARKYITN